MEGGKRRDQGVLRSSYSGLLAVQGGKPFKPEFQSTLESFDQSRWLKSQREQKVGAKVKGCKRNAATNEAWGASLLWDPWPWAPESPEELQEVRDRITTEEVSPEAGELNPPDRTIQEDLIISWPRELAGDLALTQVCKGTVIQESPLPCPPSWWSGITNQRSLLYHYSLISLEHVSLGWSHGMLLQVLATS